MLGSHYPGEVVGCSDGEYMRALVSIYVGATGRDMMGLKECSRSHGKRKEVWG